MNSICSVKQYTLTMESPQDKLYAQPLASLASFVFDESVADVFEDMIRRSVPGYAMTLSLMPLIAQRYAQAGTRCYDLGCSLGAGMIALEKGLGDTGAQLVGIDNSSPMLDRCRANLEKSAIRAPFELHCQDIQEATVENASIVVVNFTLQFIPKGQRTPLAQKIYDALKPGGILLLSEKVNFKDDRVQTTLFDLHHDFKRSQGYTDLEISQKRAAIEDVLITETIEQHTTRIAAAGFAHCETWLQCFNFVSMLAVK